MDFFKNVFVSLERIGRRINASVKERISKKGICGKTFVRKYYYSIHVRNDEESFEHAFNLETFYDAWECYELCCKMKKDRKHDLFLREDVLLVGCLGRGKVIDVESTIVAEKPFLE